ncbi:DUF1146 family protein [Aquibacillus koreensis]|uniref:DUF1146 family protein n=2 Tax=Aquibacillus koreensis TaxID=279446 RepID=A0A9X4AIT7_9BACI|nr:DUF1146 family protein [Aquibacillus koreensis]MCT2535097.1 DUF1146 family protein [Aquibacillus koreensis]MDC3419740.1 DUF1146 family protein [Aquibacillus koreensis]
MQILGQDALISMLSHIIFIIITWYAIQSVNFDEWFRKMKVFEARILIIFITIAIGTTVSRFFLEFLSWSQQLIYLF